MDDGHYVVGRRRNAVAAADVAADQGRPLAGGLARRQVQGLRRKDAHAVYGDVGDGPLC